MRLEPEDSQQPPEPREVAVDDAFQVRHPPTAPVLVVLPRQEAHPDEHVDGRHDAPALKKTLYSAREAGVERILSVFGESWLVSCHGR